MNVGNVGPQQTLTITEQDGAPLVTGVQKIKFPNGSVTDNGGGVVSVVTNAGDGTVTSVSVVDANNITGTVATATTTPAITLAVGGIPINSQSAAYSTVLADAGKAVFHPSTDNNARTFTIDGSVAYVVGTAITFINLINTVTIAIGTDTLTLLPAGTTGSRTLAANNMATAVKVASGAWVITGTSGLT